MTEEVIVNVCARPSLILLKSAVGLAFMLNGDTKKFVVSILPSGISTE